MNEFIVQERLSPSRTSAHPQDNTWYLSTHPEWGNIDNGCLKAAHFLKKRGNDPNISNLSRDLLDVAAVLYIADRLVLRQPWIRDLHFEIPVHEKERWDECHDLLIETVTRLSGDNISIEFVPRAFHQELDSSGPFAQKSGKDSDSKVHDRDCVMLFSGGVDSFAGLVQLEQVDGRHPLLISHSPGPIGGVQRNLFGKYSGIKIERPNQHEGLFQAALGPRRHSPHNRVTQQSLGYSNELGQRREKMENSQRMRSFLHLSLATVIARQLSLPDVFIVDNGILSINLPLVPCRSGSRSTRSTDPLFLKLYQDLVNSLFDASICIRNPFIFKTKAEIVKFLKEQGQARLIKDTISCWAYPRGLRQVKYDARTSSKPITHCGYCLPCLIRRLAIRSCGLERYDAGYARDILQNFGKAPYQPGGEDYSKTEHFRDLLYFCTRLTNIESELGRMAAQSKRDLATLERIRFLTDYPELSLIPGTVNVKKGGKPLQEAIDMYKRFSRDVLSVVQDKGNAALQAWVSR